MKALIVGAGGQLGRALRATAPGDWRCVALSRDALDVTDAARVAETIEREKADIVLNAAAYTAVDRAEDDSEAAMAVNARGVANLADALRATGGRLVHVSTDYVFDGESCRAYAPQAERRPLSVYGRSKAVGEDLAGDGALIVRTSWLYAASGRNFVTTMLRLMREGEDVHVVADQVAAPTWARGLARVLWALAGQQAYGVWHHRDGGVASWYDFACAIAEEALALGLLQRMPDVRAVPTCEFPTTARRPPFSLLDDRATRMALGWSPPHWRVHLRAMLREEAAFG